MVLPFGKWFMNKIALLVQEEIHMKKMYVNKKLFFIRLLVAFTQVFRHIFQGFIKIFPLKLKYGLILKFPMNSLLIANYINKESLIIQIVSRTYCLYIKFI